MMFPMHPPVIYAIMGCINQRMEVVGAQVAIQALIHPPKAGHLVMHAHQVFFLPIRQRALPATQVCTPRQ